MFFIPKSVGEPLSKDLNKQINTKLHSVKVFSLCEGISTSIQSQVNVPKKVGWYFHGSVLSLKPQSWH